MVLNEAQRSNQAVVFRSRGRVVGVALDADKITDGDIAQSELIPLRTVQHALRQALKVLASMSADDFQNGVKGILRQTIAVDGHRNGQCCAADLLPKLVVIIEADGDELVLEGFVVEHLTQNFFPCRRERVAL